MKRLAPRSVVLVVLLSILVFDSSPRLLRFLSPGGPIPEPPWLSHQASSVTAAVLPVETARLEIEDRTSRSARNIFAFAESRRDPKEDRREDPDPVVISEPDPKPEQEERREPVPEVSLVGVFGPERLRIAVLEDPGASGMSNVREGDVARGGFIVENIDLMSIELRQRSLEAEPVRLEVGGSQRR